MQFYFQENEYKTSDFNFAAFLKASSVLFLGVKPERNRKFFYFENSDPQVIDRLKLAYFRCEKVQMAPLEFCREQQALRAFLYDDV